ncbi:MAG: SpvB/TcaC N-terminal domain-containing protein [Candidatus Omnitrophota bacterium]|nr:SpvB/TcaC N-terminal domain-containing protein [Candidatus Omnitrophota bacterium]
MIRPKIALVVILSAFFSLGMAPKPKPPAGDTTPPQVSISSPANNSTVSGTVNIQATATDNLGVTKVEFYVDNVLKATDTSLPYAYSWDSSTATNASHALKAKAYDAKNNSKAAEISVTVKNTATPPPTPPTPPPTPPTPPTPPPAPNPAEEEIKIPSAVVSSYNSSSKTAVQTIDNYFSTYWEGKYRVSWLSSKVLTNWWLRLDLDKPYNLSKISIWWYKGFGASNYSIQGSNDYQAWTNIQAGLSSAGGNTNPYQTDHALTGSYRYVRISINKAQASYPRIYEVKLYSKPPDTTPPTGSIKINNATQYTNSTTVTLSLSAQDNTGGSGLAQMHFSNDGTNFSAAENYSSAKTWALSPGDGQKTVYVKFSDQAGNWSQAYISNITLDTTPPALTINPVQSPTNQNVVIAYTVGDNLTPSNQITVTGNNSPYTNEGTHTATLTAKDAAGNSSTGSVSFTIDKTLPAVIITAPQNGEVIEEAPVQFQGMVDGVAFSENRSLNDGPNTLTKTATDAAGNTASSCITVNYYTGQLIGPEGGEVTSPDGRVKLIIPAGAVDKPTRIKASTNIKPEILEKFKSSDKTLLSVVRCERYPEPDASFNKIVTLIYLLEKAQVPGTPVNLGLYDGKEMDIIGDPSLVPEDGVTLTFMIGHFSTYGALQGMISQGAPIGGGVKIPLPDMFTGSFSHSVPITVPPGRKGMQPSISLNYRSSNANSWVGTGFSLNPGYIVRSTRLGPPKYTDDDTFYLVTDGGTTEMTLLTDTLTGKLYQAKIESGFTKFYKENDGSWKVVAKDGSKLLFGDSADSREVGSKGTFAWYLTEAVDTNGNYITYKYARNNQENKCYLSRIEYTGNKNAGTLPLNQVDFVLQDRTDIFSSYISGSKIITRQRLIQIKVSVDNAPVWIYDLAYIESPSTGRSQLKSVTQKSAGADGKILPVQTFEYQQAR